MSFVESRRHKVYKLFTSEDEKKFKQSFQEISDSDLFADELLVIFKDQSKVVKRSDLLRALGLSVPEKYTRNNAKEESLTALFPEPEMNNSQPSTEDNKLKPEHIPRQQVTFRLATGFSITAAYHDVIVEDPYIILVWNTRAYEMAKITPDKGTKFVITCLNKNILEEEVEAEGLTFTYKGIEFCVLKKCNVEG